MCNLYSADKPTFGLAYLEQLRNSEVLLQSNGDKDPTNAHNEVDDSDDGWSQFVTSESSASANCVSSAQLQTVNGRLYIETDFDALTYLWYGREFCHHNVHVCVCDSVYANLPDVL